MGAAKVRHEMTTLQHWILLIAVIIIGIVAVVMIAWDGTRLDLAGVVVIVVACLAYVLAPKGDPDEQN